MKNFFTLFICFSFIFSCEKKSDRSSDFKNQEKIYNKELVLLQEYELPPSIYFHLKFENGYLWTFDSRAGQLIRISTDFSQTKKFGKKGNGLPEENGFIMFFDASQTNSYSLYDFDKRLFKIFKYDDSLIHHQRKSPTPEYRGVSLSEDTYFLWDFEEIDGDGIGFYTYNFKTDKKGEKIFLNHMPALKSENDGRYLGEVYSGDFVKSPNGERIIFYCWFGGRFFSFNKKGDLLYTSKTRDEAPFPKVMEQKASGSVFLTRDPNYQYFFSAAMNNENLMLLNFISQKDKYQIDIYDIEDGRYKSSIKLDELTDGQRPKNITIDNNIIFIMYENNTLIKYEIN